jgi:hypothetical protein
MYSNDLDLERGDLIEIMYRVWRRMGDSDQLYERWLSAEIVDREPGMRPIARLQDGQMTEVRRFMTWRHIVKAERGKSDSLAA